MSSVSKAIAGAIASALVAFLASKGYVVNPDVSEALAVVLAAIIGFAVVYISPPNRP